MTDETTPTMDLQDPLPESNWLWRRVFVFFVTAAVLWMVWGAITRLGASAMLEPTLGVPALLTLCKWLLGLTAIMATYYMIAPSAEQMTKMIKTATLLRSGVQVAGKQVIRTPETTTETQKVVGVPPLPLPDAPNLGSAAPSERFEGSGSGDSGQPADDVPWAAEPPLPPPSR